MNNTKRAQVVPPVRVILDTDIGPDCDDAGAVAVLHALVKRGEARIAGMLHCTSSHWGAGCLDALNRYYGHEDIPVGTLQEEGFLDDDSIFAKYNKEIAENYSNRFRSAKAPDATRIYRQLLADEVDGSTVVVAIGPLINLQKLLQSKPDDISPLSGYQLAARKVRHLVVMGGYFPEGEEWNFAMHPAAAEAVTSQWPTPITFTGFEIGEPIQTGARLFAELPASDPVRKSYSLYAGEGNTRSSWDLTAVLYAVRGPVPYWETVVGRIAVDGTTGKNLWIDDPAGMHAYLKALTDPDEVAALLDALMVEM